MHSKRKINIKQSDRRLNFWVLQVIGWSCYFVFTLLGSIEAFDSVGKAALINGVFSVYGFLTTSGLRSILKTSAFQNKPITYLISAGVLISMLLCWIIVVTINVIILSFEGLSIDEVNLSRLFEGTFKFLFVFLGWIGIYFGGKFWTDLQVEKQKLLYAEATNKELQLQMLKNQLNPHFLFNTMNSISALISVDPERAELMIDKFSVLLRRSLSSNYFEWISIEEELELIEDYLIIEKIRFGNNVNYSISKEEGISKVKIPVFLLYPLVENAVKYGVKTSDRPLSVEVKSFLKDGYILLQCINTGTWFNSEEVDDDGLGIGLENVRKRLEIAFGNKQSLNIYEKENRVVAEIKIQKDETIHFHSHH